MSDGLVSKIGRWEAMVAAVRTLHSKRSFNGDGYGWTVCAECRQAWPCATERAVAEALGDWGR